MYGHFERDGAVDRVHVFKQDLFGNVDLDKMLLRGEDLASNRDEFLRADRKLRQTREKYLPEVRDQLNNEGRACIDSLLR